MGVPCGHVHAQSSGDARHGLTDAAKADDAKLLAVQLVAVGTVPIACFDLPVEFADLSGEFHKQCDGVFGHGMVAIVHHIAYADSTFLGFVEIDVTGHAGAAECIAFGVQPIEDGIGAVESDHHDGVSFGATFDDGVFVKREILVHAHAGNVFEQFEVLFERFDHRFDDDGHDHQWQIGAFRLGFVDFHVFTSHCMFESSYAYATHGMRHIVPRKTTGQMNSFAPR